MSTGASSGVRLSSRGRIVLEPPLQSQSFAPLGAAGEVLAPSHRLGVAPSLIVSPRGDLIVVHWPFTNQYQVRANTFFNDTELIFF